MAAAKRNDAGSCIPHGEPRDEETKLEREKAVNDTRMWGKALTERTKTLDRIDLIKEEAHRICYGESGRTVPAREA